MLKQTLCTMPRRLGWQPQLFITDQEMILTICFLNRELRKQFLFVPHTFIPGPSTAVACCPAALWCSLSPAVTAILVRSPPGSQLDPHCLPYGKGLAICLCICLFISISEDTLCQPRTNFHKGFTFGLPILCCI